jgi:Uma2 family endonuclease
MGMPNVARRWTREEVLALPNDGNRYELVDGELLVTPSPRGVHQRGVWRLYDRIAPYVRSHRLGVAGLAPADLDLAGGQLLQPDLFVAGLAAGKEPIEWADYPVPLLVVEVLSPSTARHDRITKRLRYQRSGVDEYWIVDLDARIVERWRPDDERPEILSEVLPWQATDGLDPLTIDLPMYFGEVWVER